MAKFDHADFVDLMPLFLLAKLDTSGVMDELKAAEAISNVVDRHVERALEARDTEPAIELVSERWIVAVEGVAGTDGRGLLRNEMIWREQVAVKRNKTNSYESKVIGKLSDFRRNGAEISALYEGEKINGTISCDVKIISTVGQLGGSEYWYSGEIAGAYDIDGPTFLGDLVRRA